MRGEEVVSFFQDIPVFLLATSARKDQDDEEGATLPRHPQSLSSALSLLVRLHLANARRLHWSCHSVDYGEA